MCSEGVSVWFACKLCKSFFLNADDFAYHKKKYHVQQFQNTKFIVFEEQTTPTASPPKNWVTFLSPKEEIQVHRIISLTNVEYDLNHSNTQTNRSEEFIQIDSETNEVCNYNDNGDGVSNDADQISNNCFELNCDFNSNYDVQKAVNNVQENEPLQISTAPTTSTDSGFTDEKRDKHSLPITQSTLKSKTSSLKRSKQIFQNVPFKKTLQTPVQSPKNPYVYLKRLNLITLQNESPSPSNITTNAQENYKSNNSNHIDNSNANTAKESKEPHGNYKKSHGINSKITSPPLAIFGTCKYCSKHFHSTAELDIHQDICRLKRQFNGSIICVPCLLTFGSSHELIDHNRTFHSTSFSTPSKNVDDNQTKFLSDPEVAPKTEIEPEPEMCYALSKNQAQSNVMTNLPPLSTNYQEISSKNDNRVWEGKIIYEASDNKLNISLGSSSSSSENIIVPDDGPFSGPSTQINFSHGEILLETVKTDDDDVPCRNEDSEFPVVNQDPLESVSRLEESESFADQTLNGAESSSSPSTSPGNQEPMILIPQIDFALRCFTCEKTFISMQELYDHNKNYHRTPDGDRNTIKTSSSTSEKMVSGRTTLSKEQQETYDDWKRRSPDQLCVVCGSKFTKNAIRNRHILIVHVQTNRNKIPCTAHVGCRYKASTKGDMKKHLKGKRARERVPVASAEQSLEDEVDVDLEESASNLNESGSKLSE